MTNDNCNFFSYTVETRSTDIRLIRTLWHVPLVSVLCGFHCIVNPRFGPSYEKSTSVSNIQIPRLDTRQCWKVTRFFLAKLWSPHSLFLHVTIKSKVWKLNVRLRSIGHFFFVSLILSDCVCQSNSVVRLNSIKFEFSIRYPGYIFLVYSQLSPSDHLS